MSKSSEVVGGGTSVAVPEVSAAAFVEEGGGGKMHLEDPKDQLSGE